MASGLPIACSDRGPLTEILGSGGMYFDPESPDQIARAIERLVDDANLRAKKAEISFQLSTKYSWQDCSSKTFNFLEQVALESKNILRN